MQTQYFVTRNGLAAAIKSPEALSDLKSVLLSQAAPRKVGKLKQLGLIAPEQRKQPGRIEHNALVLDGAIDRIREIVFAKPANGNGHAAAKPAERPMPPRIGYVQTRPGSAPRDLTPSTARVLQAIGKRPRRIGEIASRVKDIHPNTVRWAVQILRQRRLVKSIELEG